MGESKFQNPDKFLNNILYIDYFLEICVSEDKSGVRGSKAGNSKANNPPEVGYSEVVKTSEAGDPEVDHTSEAHPDDEEYEKARDGPTDA